MTEEIERKFLVKNRNYRKEGSSLVIRQGFLSSEKSRIVRIRFAGTQAFITIKGPGKGIRRQEFEYEIPAEDAHIMLENICEQPLIEKIRYIVVYKGFKWEVDEFLGVNKGLVIAEIELKHEDQDFPKPGWLGKEVSHDPRYYNANLIKNPYQSWHN